MLKSIVIMFKKLVFIVIILLVVVGLVIPLVGLYLISDSYSLIQKAAVVKTDDVIRAKQISKSLYVNVMDGDPNKLYSLKVSEDEINSIIGLATRGLPRLSGRANLTNLGIVVALSANIEESPFGNFINASATIIPSNYGLAVDEVTIGNISLSGKLAVALVEKLANRLSNSESIGSQLISSIKSVSVEQSTAMVKYQSLPELKQAIESAKSQFKNLRDDLELVIDPVLVRSHYLNLCEFHAKIDGLGDASLGYYLSASFSFAKKRSVISRSAVEENRAALLAQAIFLGSGRFNSVLGAVNDSDFDKCQPEKTRIVLANRSDLRLHFIFSAALKIITDSGISITIGEFKELLDSAQGGSGFSFADLAADKAGVRFAEYATEPSSAQTLQAIASELQNEAMFFPSIKELPEGISQEQFDANGGLEGSFYARQLDVINSRINKLVLYR